VGGVALLSYVEGRNTQDIYLIVRAEEIGALEWSATVQDNDFGRAVYGGVRVDLLLRSNPFFDFVATNERALTEFHGRPIQIASRRGLLLLGSDVDSEGLLESLTGHLSKSDVAELARVLAEQREKRRFE
jgi:hypothetical protein